MICILSLCNEYVNIKATNKILQRIPGMLWTPGVSKYFQQKTIEQIKANLLQQPHPYVVKPNQGNEIKMAVKAALPTSLDWSQINATCVNHIRDQGDCGSCWAFSVVDVFGDQRCISKKDSKFVQYSEQYELNCVANNYGCNGGYVYYAWQFLVQSGAATDQCVPYYSGTSEVAGTCPLLCNGLGMSGSPIVKKYATSFYFACTSVNTMLTAIQSGPLSATFNVYQDFISYQSGIYHHVYGAYLGGHAIEIVGYGVQGTTQFWKIKNSWGTDWGEQGYFRMLRGRNECGIETECYIGMV